VAVDPALAGLTDEQLVAAAAKLPAVFLEAAPGSGKTTVAAQRFGALRFSRRTSHDGSLDDRPVLAVSFTRSATAELRHRVRRSWGPAALAWPHRICTLDTLVYDLLRDVLAGGLVTWPGGHIELDVKDSWKALVRHGFSARQWGASVDGSGRVVVRIVRRHEYRRAAPEPEPMRAELAAGRCTHEDVRRIITRSLRDRPEVRERVRQRLATTVGALIVDEVYDANPLDIALIRAVAGTGASVTVIGDPWQAMYGFRGATPDKVPALIEATGMVTLPLSQSFRWRTPTQRSMAERLRGGEGVALDVVDSTADVDIVLAREWGLLWTADTGILPLAFGSTTGNVDEAASTLLLHCATRSLLRLDAVFLADALATLGITDVGAVDRLMDGLGDLLTTLKQASTRAAVKCVRSALVTLVQTESRRHFPKIHYSHVERLESLHDRLHAPRLIPGVTVHQAKGREWDRVGLRLTEDGRATLAAGLDRDNEAHRLLYVACTRARDKTVELRPAV
jgi:DNA helicase-2/ATP-dependent DNA helicase PcrA